MTDHVAKQVLDATVTACTGLSTTGSKVYRSRVHTMLETNLPALLIYARDDVMEGEMIGMQTDPAKGGFRGIAGPAALVEDGKRVPSGRLGCPVPSPFKTYNHVNGIVGRTMYRNFLIIAGVNDNPQPHGGVPPVVKYHVRLLGVSLYAWV